MKRFNFNWPLLAKQLRSQAEVEAKKEIDYEGWGGLLQLIVPGESGLSPSGTLLKKWCTGVSTPSGSYLPYLAKLARLGMDDFYTERSVS